VRERREKTRLRVARWRAKRKLQACLNQTQAHGDAAVLAQAGDPVSNQRQQHRSPYGKKRHAYALSLEIYSNYCRYRTK
ncbi:hypothetical protein XENORESO_007006, partial [Xenotaenia resolanae]